MFSMLKFVVNSLRKFSSKSGRKQAIEEYLKRQSSDYFSRLAKEHCYRARSAFKLLAINDKHKIIFPGDVVIDIGAAPGSWSQVAAELVFDIFGNEKVKNKNPKKIGYVLGVDLQPLVPLSNVDFIGQADITRQSTHDKIKKKLNGRMVDALISDMAPNPTGDHYTDHLRLIELCRLLIRLTLPENQFYASTTNPGINLISLQPNGRFLCKIFDGKLTNIFAEELKYHFKFVKIVKPIASRETSSESYLLARDLILPNSFKS